MSQANADESPELTKQRIVDGFNKLRKEQRYYSMKIQEFEADVKEHRLVIDALKEINDEKRGCYRLIGGVLVGRTVGEILPSLEKNVENIEQLMKQYRSFEAEKGKEINEFMKKYQIKFVDAPGGRRPDEEAAAAAAIEQAPSKSQPAAGSSAVLIGE